MTKKFRVTKQKLQFSVDRLGTRVEFISYDIFEIMCQSNGHQPFINNWSNFYETYDILMIKNSNF